MNQINVLKLGRKEYTEVLELQRKLQQLRIDGKIGNVLILVEHEPVLTLGTSGKHANILMEQSELEKSDIKIVKVERGGDVTYHGPGQLVGYPIFDLNDFGRDVHDYSAKMQESIIRFLRDDYHIDAGRSSGRYTGVWIGNKKITAVGVSLKKWVTMHGFALNVNTNLDHFKWIIPCGLADAWVTSIKEQVGHEVDLDEAADRIIHYFSEVFDAEMHNTELQELVAE